jgi:inosine-uridine nucleoside N-ribohydrolase
LVLVATGPLTNIAAALLRDPELPRRLKRFVLMGGAFREPGNVTPAAEFNIWADPEAAYRVFTSELDVTMVGLDVTHKALMTQAHVDRFDGKAGKLVADMYGFYSQVHARRYGWDGSPVHDAVAMAHVIDSTLLTTVRRGVVVDTGPEPSRGRTHVDLQGAHWEPNAHVAVDIDAERFLGMLIERISSLG